MESNIIKSADTLMMIVGIIIFAGILFTKLSEKIKLPDVVLYIFAGFLLGPSLFDVVNIAQYPIENQMILSFGAAYILYDGGREIDLKVLNQVKHSVLSLATLGVFISTFIIGGAAHFIFNIPLIYALLMGAIIASTDPSVLVPLFKKMNISPKLKQTIISESAFNDAAGAIITFTILSMTMGSAFSIETTIFDFFKTVIGGVVIGAVFGYLSHVLTNDRPSGIFKTYAAELMLATVIGAYLISNYFGFSGFMSVFIVGMICGNKKRFHFWIPEDSFQSHLRFKEVLTILLRMMIFILLGANLHLNVIATYFFPSILTVIILIFVARPLSVFICTLFDKKAKWTIQERLYMMWVRETGVIPAALAGMLITANIPYADRISSVTFMTIIITLSFQASTSKWLAKVLKLTD